MQGYFSNVAVKHVPVVNDRDELRPYRALDHKRLKLAGTGIAGLSYLICCTCRFLEPRINEFAVDPPRSSSRF